MEIQENSSEEFMFQAYRYAKELMDFYKLHKNINYDETWDFQSLKKLYESAVLYAVTGDYSSFPVFYFRKDTSLSKCQCKVFLTFDCKLSEIFSNCTEVLNSLWDFPWSGLYLTIQKYAKEHAWSRNVCLDPASEWDTALSSYNIFDGFFNMVSVDSFGISLNNDNTMSIVEIVYKPLTPMYNYIDIYQYFWFVMFEKARVAPDIAGEWDATALPSAAYGKFLPQFDEQSISAKIDKLFGYKLSDLDDSKILVNYLNAIMDSYKKSPVECFPANKSTSIDKQRLTSIRKVFKKSGGCCDEDIAYYNFLESLLDTRGTSFYNCFLKNFYYHMCSRLYVEIAQDKNSRNKDICFYMECTNLCVLPYFQNRLGMLINFYNKNPDMFIEYFKNIWENEITIEYDQPLNTIFSFDHIEIDSIRHDEGVYVYHPWDMVKTKVYLSVKNGWDIRKLYVYFRGKEILEGRTEPGHYFNYAFKGVRIQKIELAVYYFEMYLNEKPTSEEEEMFIGETLISSIKASVERNADNPDKNSVDFIKVQANLRTEWLHRFKDSDIEQHSSSLLKYILFILFTQKSKVKKLGLNKDCFTVSDATLNAHIGEFYITLELKDEFKNVQDETNFF